MVFLCSHSLSAGRPLETQAVALPRLTLMGERVLNIVAGDGQQVMIAGRRQVVPFTLVGFPVPPNRLRDMTFVKAHANGQAADRQLMVVHRFTGRDAVMVDVHVDPGALLGDVLVDHLGGEVRLANPLAV